MPIEKKPIKVAIYVRVSTEEQHTDNQLKILKEYCKNKDYKHPTVYIDRDSGLNENRPNFNRLLEDMRQRKFKAIVVWKLDRVGRSLQHLLQILTEMKNKGVDLIVTTQNIDTTTASGKLMFSMIGAFAEFESSLISERTILGMQRARDQGKHIGRPRKDPKIFTKYCIVSNCRTRVTENEELCEHHKHFKKLLNKKRGV